MSQEQHARGGTAAAADPSRPGGDDVLFSVEGAVDAIRSIDDVEPSQHPEQYTAVHEVLQAALTDTDVRETR